MLFSRVRLAQATILTGNRAAGLTNQEVAARLFLSHKTMEVHLGHIYDKHGVHSRTGLTPSTAASICGLTCGRA